MEKEDLILEKGNLIFGKGRSHFWKRKISFLEKEDLIFGNVASIVGKEQKNLISNYGTNVSENEIFIYTKVFNVT